MSKSAKYCELSFMHITYKERIEHVSIYLEKYEFIVLVRIAMWNKLNYYVHIIHEFQ